MCEINQLRADKEKHAENNNILAHAQPGQI